MTGGGKQRRFSVPANAPRRYLRFPAPTDLSMNPPEKPDTTPMDATAPASGPVQGSGSGFSQGSIDPRPDQPQAAPTLSVGGPGLAVGARSPAGSSGRSAARSSGGFDPGWLFVIAGVLLLGATVLIPAADDLSEAQFLRERAKLIQQHRQSRIDRYREYLNALSSKDRQLVVALAASQLNEIPADRRVVDGWNGTGPDSRAADASVFPALEPPPLVLPQRRHVESTLMRWTMEEKSRLWVIAGGAALVLFGLLPRATRRA